MHLNYNRNIIEFNLQESEIVEVLWKQDVDLGYTLAPVKPNSPKESANTSGPSFNTEDNEKLRALQELKNEKVSTTSEHFHCSYYFFFIIR